ncbi:hypothetical protein EWM64_g1644 [Hericium alpestre]|uniref:Mitochondrial outer membrane transport complex Sam37/metaxin N-terminal domain-containing protein n=1 Tax=Hericium alpestre TaxID=135208 RepID=A0A4Z0A5P6_9AGAM|nr:hypothetical protein EWM64_g1644 [Hericium alpestre]
MSSSSSIPTLHIWPAKWDLPSMEPACLAAVLYLQLSIPGRFAVVETANPDSSPSGQLPYLTHLHHALAPFSSILKYVNGLTQASLPHENSNTEHMFSADLDTLLSTSERAQRTACPAIVDVFNAQAHMFYSLPANYADVTHPALVSFLPIPQRYYVPHRIRDAYHKRLEASGLWNLPGEEIEEQEPAPRPVLGKKEQKKPEDPKKTFKSAFERERVLERARSAFGLYARLLGDNRFFYYDRPTTIDVLLASHILLLINPPFPDPLLPSLLSSSYPTLLTHTRRVFSTAFPTPYIEDLHYLPSTGHSLASLLPPLPSLRSLWSTEQKEKSEEEKRFDRMRRAWFGMAVVGALAYWMVWGPKLVIRFAPDEEEYEEEDVEDDGFEYVGEDEEEIGPYEEDDVV